MQEDAFLYEKSCATKEMDWIMNEIKPSHKGGLCCFDQPANWLL